MADYKGMFRTNYFKVKNLKKFTGELEDWKGSSCDGEPIHIDDGNGKMCLYGYCTIPDKRLSREKGGPLVIDDNADFAEFIQEHLDNDVAIIQEIGYEKLRYFVGISVIVSPDKIETIDIHAADKIIKKMGFDPREVSGASY